MGRALSLPRAAEAVGGGEAGAVGDRLGGIGHQVPPRQGFNVVGSQAPAIAVEAVAALHTRDALVVGRVGA